MPNHDWDWLFAIGTICEYLLRFYLFSTVGLTRHQLLVSNAYRLQRLLLIGTIALDAFNIGANDVANVGHSDLIYLLAKLILSRPPLPRQSFATSVASRSLTLRQACFAAALCEFGGAVLVGARVSGTIKNSIIVRLHPSPPPLSLSFF
jgi:phosphate/sulfate permease